MHISQQLSAMGSSVFRASVQTRELPSTRCLSLVVLPACFIPCAHVSELCTGPVTFSFKYPLDWHRTALFSLKFPRQMRFKNTEAGLHMEKIITRHEFLVYAKKGKKAFYSCPRCAADASTVRPPEMQAVASLSNVYRSSPLGDNTPRDGRCVP